MLASELKQSKESFESGVNLIHEKKYIKAINDFKNVKDSDKKRYNQAQEKIKEASNLYIEDNIPKAKAEATNKQYDNAINILETILKFDSNNKETINLKDTYNLEIQKIRDEEEEKKHAEKEADIPCTDTSNSAPVPTNNSGDTVKYNNEGWFKVNLNSGVPTREGFGIMSMGYSVQPNGIYYRFIGNNVQYEITLHLPTGDVKDNGNLQVMALFLHLCLMYQEINP
jgi:tetratricopeptide (TPR) repeat protein